MLSQRHLKAAVGPRARAVLYLRQSVSREDSISLELQEDAGRRYAAERGYNVVAVEADPGISGRTWNRPAVARVMAMIDEDRADVIVLWKWSRLSRSRRDWAIAVDAVESKGGRIESATEAIDTTTATGRFARGMLAEFAAFESERIGDVWRESHARRVRNGLPANGKPRFGYSYSKETGFTPDPIAGPVLAEAYARYVAGESVYSLVAWLNAGETRPVSGYGRSSDGLWSDRTLRRVLDSGFAAGLITVSGERHPGAHAAIIAPELWSAYLVTRSERRVVRNSERSEYLLSGLVRCACGSSMNGGQHGQERQMKYRCKAAKEKRTHTGGYVTAAHVEAAVLAWLSEYDVAISAQMAAVAGGPIVAAVVDRAGDIRKRLRKIEQRIDALTERLLDGTVPQDSYRRAASKLELEREALESELRSVEVRSTHRPAALIPTLLSNWDSMAVAQRRAVLKALIDRVVVTPGRPRAQIDIVERA